MRTYKHKPMRVPTRALMPLAYVNVWDSCGDHGWLINWAEMKVWGLYPIGYPMRDRAYAEGFIWLTCDASYRPISGIPADRILRIEPYIIRRTFGRPVINHNGLADTLLDMARRLRLVRINGLSMDEHKTAWRGGITTEDRRAEEAPNGND